MSQWFLFFIFFDTQSWSNSSEELGVIFVYTESGQFYINILSDNTIKIETLLLKLTLNVLSKVGNLIVLCFKRQILIVRSFPCSE